MFFRRRRISVGLHVGVHRTASTYLQNLMQRNQPLLRRSGVVAYGPWLLRDEGQSIQDRFDLNNPDGPAEGWRVLRHISGGCKRVILSEENFIGVFAEPDGRLRSRLYPNAVPHVTSLLESLDTVPLDIYIAVRHPIDWITSCYSQVLMSGRMVTPEYFLQDVDPLALDWSELVGRLRAIPGVARMAVWPYEEFPENLKQVSLTVLQRQISDAPRLPGEVSHPGLSQAAVDVALREGTGEAARRARQDFPISDEHPRFDPFPMAVREAADQAYLEQLDRIASLEGVEFIRLPGHR